MVTTMPGIHTAAPAQKVFAFWANPQDLDQLAHGLGGPGEVIKDVKLSPEVADASCRVAVKVRGRAGLLREVPVPEASGRRGT